MNALRTPLIRSCWLLLWLHSWMPPSASGGGGVPVDAVAGFVTEQSGYPGLPLLRVGGAVRLQWQETQALPELVLRIDDQEGRSLSPLSTDQIPGQNAFMISNLDIGTHVFTLEVQGAVVAQAEQSVVRLAPPNTAQGLLCAGSDTPCEARVSWRQALFSPAPLAYDVSMDGSHVLRMDGDSLQVELATEVDGEHCVTLTSVIDGTELDAPENLALPAKGAFRTTPVSICCNVSCTTTSIGSFGSRQTVYELATGTNAVRLRWLENESVAGTVEVFVNGGATAIASVPALNSTEQAENEALLEGLPEGDHDFTFTVNGKRVEEGTVQTVVSEPVVGAIVNLACQCEEEDEEEDCEITVCWGPVEPVPGSYEIYLDDTLVATTAHPEDAAQVAALASGRSCVTVAPYIDWSDVGMLGSFGGTPAQVCCQTVCGNVYLEGSCDGRDGDLDLATVIYTLFVLFVGELEPPCLAACELNGDRRFDVADIIYALDFLFRLGPTPSVWRDNDGDGHVEQNCQIAPLDDCRSSHEACSL